MTTPPPPVSLVFFPVTATNFAVADPAVSGTINDPIIQPVSGLVTFTPRLMRGRVFWIDNYLVQAEYNAEQTVNVINNPNQGEFALQLLATWTAPMPYNVSTAAMQAALITAANASAGDITVSAGIGAWSYDVKFAGNLAGQAIPVMNADPMDLQNAQGQSCEVTVDGTFLGGPQIVAPTGISIPPRQARIWDGVLSTIDEGDTPGVQLNANQPELQMGADGVEPIQLIYDVSFDSVSYNGESQILAPWAFVAPTDATPVDLATVGKIPYQPPISQIWSPGPFFISVAPPASSTLAVEVEEEESA